MSKEREKGSRRRKFKRDVPAVPPANQAAKVSSPVWDQLSEWYQPFARQKEFHNARAKYRLFGGAAGPGKTKALLWETIRQALEVEKCDTLLLRRTFPELESSVLMQFLRDVPRDLYQSYNQEKHLVTWNNGSTTRFGYCRNENDVYQYQGAEFLFIGFDELTHFTLKQWQFLTSRNRCAVPKYTCGPNKDKKVFACMAGATNPGNVGHAWVKALWVDKVAPPGYDRPEQYDAADYEFIRARIEDNPIYAHDANYLKTLDALPERLRKAMLEGDWDFYAGQYFDVFDKWRHTARAEEIGIQPWWPRWISIDWGFRHPSAVYWHCAVPQADIRYPISDIRQHANSEQRPVSSDEVPIKEGSLHSESRNARLSGRDDSGRGGDEASVADRLRRRSLQRPRNGTPRIATYREFVKSELSPRMLGQAIAERTGGEQIREVVLSPDAFAHRTSEASIAEQLGEVLEQNGLPRPTLAEDDRIGGWQLMYQMLESDEWVITENCSELIEGLPLLVRDESRVEDVQKVDGDDAADAARYGIVSGVRYAGLGAHAYAKATARRPGAGQAPPEFANGTARFVPGMPLDVQIERQISAADPTSRAIHAQRLEAQARKQLAAVKFSRRRWW